MNHDNRPSRTIHDLAMKHAATSKLSTRAKEAFVNLYIDGRDGLVGWLELANFTTRDRLFEILQHEIQGDLNKGDKFDIVRFQRVGGEAFPRVNERTVPIKRSGSKAMWIRLVEIMLENGVGDVKGYVVVKKGR
jgi:L-alanine-DL-glutamate epimerase-like enolase superfamily enzyme